MFSIFKRHIDRNRFCKTFNYGFWTMNNKFKFSLALILIAVFGALPLYAGDGNGKYARFCSQLKEKLCVDISIPESLVEFPSQYGDGGMFTFTFAENRVSSLSISGSPILVAGPLAELSEGCTVVLPSLEHVQKPNPEHRPPQGEYDMPRASAFMLDNCETESAHWVINDIYGIVRPEETAALQEKCRALREMNERRFEDGVLVEKTNSDLVFIVRLPYIEKVTSAAISSPSCPEIDERLHARAKECYAVEFYKRSSYDPLEMLFFIDTDKTTIDECVSMMAGYVRFE